jgi:hypothetical protein
VAEGAAVGAEGGIVTLVYDVRLLGHELSERIQFEVCWVHGLDSVCWIWTDKLQNKGYGYLGDRTKVLHRITYRVLIGQIPPGLVLDHLCRRRACCNPAHLEAVTQQVNCQRAASAAREGIPACNSDAAREAFERVLQREAAAAIAKFLTPHKATA